ncbi:MAG: DinB family protein [Chthoniobacter sp.]|nr:DinB family protein [Chthoniobacter sp.]
MNATTHPATAPTLAAPGAGLPLLEAWFARLFIRPLLRRRYSRETALDAIEQTATRLLKKTAPLSPEQLTTPKLIPRLRGLEDSSRFWSPSMVLEHLSITGRGTIRMVIQLTNEQRPTRAVSTATVKPTGRDPMEVREEFAALHRGARQEIAAAAGAEWNGLSHAHPWFGPLNATDWLRMMAMHLQLHENQLNLVLKS